MAISKIETNSLGSTTAVHSDTTLSLQTNGTTTAVTIDASQNVGIGTAPSAWDNTYWKVLQVGATANSFIADGGNGVGFFGSNSYNDGTNKFIATGYAQQYYQDTTGGTHIWRTSTSSGSANASITWAERMRIDSGGNLLVGTTTAYGTETVARGTSGYTYTSVSIANQSEHFGFYNTSTLVGSITRSGGTGVAYNTSSDYRLKENIAPMTGALDTVAQLKPVTYNWKADGSSGQGFIAHELAEVVPDCVTGEKDAVDEEGNPQYQGIDTSFLVATLTKAIQELNAKVDAQALEIQALKGVA